MNFAIVFAVVVLVALYSWWHYQRINAMVAAWAQSNGYKLLEVHRWYLTFPPIGMLLTTSREQSIVHIKVLDPATQRIREGYLRLGSYWWGTLDFNAAEVRWQGE